MAKFKFVAGAEFDTITKQEMEDALKKLPSWMAETQQGIRYSKFVATATPASNAVDFGGPDFQGDMLGPDPGFIWDIRRLYIAGLNTADTVTIYQNDANPSSIIDRSIGDSSRVFYWTEQVVLYPGDALRIVGSGLNAGTTNVTVTGQVREVPMTLAWRLGN